MDALKNISLSTIILKIHKCKHDRIAYYEYANSYFNTQREELVIKLG